MQAIKVQTTILKTSYESMETLSNSLMSYSQSVTDIKNALPFSVQESEQIRNALNQVSLSIESQANSMASLSSTLNQIASQYETAENTVIDSDGNSNEKSFANLDDYDNTTTTFDYEPSNGGYGGNQGDMAYHKIGWQFLRWRLGEDEELFDFVRRYPQYADYSQKEIAQLMKQMNKEGCGYISMVNSIFVAYEGREAEFEKTFGFPMYDEKGKANYNRLFIDIYAETDDKFYLNESYGYIALLNTISQSMTEEEFIKQYGCPATDENGFFTQEAKDAIMAQYDGQDVVSYKHSGNSCYTMENRFETYMHEKGINGSSQVVTSLTVEQIQEYMDNESIVTVNASDFNLYDGNGKIKHKDVGGHAMTVTGVTEDGRLIVSSWGEKYYIYPTEDIIDSYIVTTITQ